MVGTLKLKVLEAKLKRNTDWFGKMDPYAILYIDKQNVVQTSVKQGMGKTPVWNECFCFRCQIGDVLQIEIMDSDLCKKDDLVAIATYQVSQTTHQQNFALQCYYKDQNCGEIYLEVHFIDQNDIVTDDYIEFSKKKQGEQNEQTRKSIQKDIQELKQELKNNPEQQKQFEKIQELKKEINLNEQIIQEYKKQYDQQVIKLEEELIKLKYDQEDFEKEKEKFIYYDKHYHEIKENSFKGILQLQNIQVNMFVDVGSIFDKMDPYVIFSAGEAQERTEVARDAGQRAKYVDHLTIHIIQAHILVVTVFDDNVISDELAGTGALPILNIISQSSNGEKFVQQRLNMYHHSQKTGYVDFEWKFQREIII